jgi:phosphatidylglycerophosphate synthase
MNLLSLWEEFYRNFTSYRKKLVDVIATKIAIGSLNPDYITVSSLIVSFFLSLFLLLPNPSFLFIELLLASIVLFDALDGAAARVRGVNNPEKDISADRFSELLIISAIVSKDYPGGLPILFISLVNIFLPYKFIPILPLRILLFIYFFILWRIGCIPFL